MELISVGIASALWVAAQFIIAYVLWCTGMYIVELIAVVLFVLLGRTPETKLNRVNFVKYHTTLNGGKELVPYHKYDRTVVYAPEE